MHNSGQTIELAAGDFRATIVTVGAGIAALRHKGRDLLLSHRPEEIARAHLGKVLLPWPNRLAQGTYVFDGERYDVAVNDRASGAAIHGLVAWKDFSIVEQSEDRVTLETHVIPIYGYPFLLRTEITYRLDARDGLCACYETRNLCDRDAPFGVGVHPYITCDHAPMDECVLTLPCRRVFTRGADLNPRDLVDASSLDLDFTRSRALKGIVIDHTFKTDGENWQAMLESSDMKVVMTSSASWLQVYTGEKLERRGLALEPMSCPPDAFNSGIDLVILKPGTTHRFDFRIAVG